MAHQDQLAGMPSIPRVDPTLVRAEHREDLRIEVLKIAGELDVAIARREEAPLRIDDTVTIAVHGADGEVIATAVAQLEGGTVKRVKTDGVRWLEKTWTAKVAHA